MRGLNKFLLLFSLAFLAVPEAWSDAVTASDNVTVVSAENSAKNDSAENSAKNDSSKNDSAKENFVKEDSAKKYEPSAGNLKAREEFAGRKFGIFLHWGIYSTFAQGEWYMQNYDIDKEEYAKAARGFFPARFNAEEWVTAFKNAGAKYICFTTRHHDGFSMFDTQYSDYNIVKATPFGRDVLKELVDECRRQGIAVHFYYSHIDWTRDDYPMGRTGRNTGKDPEKADWNSYFNFMNNQLTELITNYSPDAIWFDGLWDHDEDPVPFNWDLSTQYQLIHSLNPSILIANNHHQTPFDGEDFQIFERDLPGENLGGLSGQEVSRLPLETCETMNRIWGYRVSDQEYKSLKQLIHLLVGAAGKGANLLLNIGPMPSGELPEMSLIRLKEMGQWLDNYGNTIYGTEMGDVSTRDWGVTTKKGNKQWIHILSLEDKSLFVPITAKIAKVVDYETRKPIKYTRTKDGILLELNEVPTAIDYIIELEMK